MGNQTYADLLSGTRMDADCTEVSVLSGFPWFKNDGAMPAFIILRMVLVPGVFLDFCLLCRGTLL